MHNFAENYTANYVNGNRALSIKTCLLQTALQYSTRAVTRGGLHKPISAQCQALKRCAIILA